MDLTSVSKYLRRNALFLSLVVGVAIGLLEIAGIWTWLSPAWVLPACIFFMLFFTFLRMDPMALRLHAWHWVLLLFQIVVSLVLYYLFRPLDTILAQGLFICVLMPSATAAPIIAGKLGGNILNLTAYTLLSNGLTALLVPLLFPLVNPAADLPFWASFVLILRRISPLLLGPFFTACLLRLTYKRISDANKRSFAANKRISDALHELPFLLWLVTLVILMAQMVRHLAVYEGSLLVLVAMFVGALLTCVLQFCFGKIVGERLPVLSPEETRVTAGQALGQKNTTLAIWLAATYLTPVSALAPTAYIIWQNVFNSWQLSRVARHLKI